MKPGIRVIDCAGFLGKTTSSVLALALERKIRVMVPIDQIVKAIEKQSKWGVGPIDTADPISSEMSEIWHDRVYLYYLDQKKSSWPSRAELLNSFGQLTSEKNYELEDVRESEDKYFEVPPHSLKSFIEGAEEVGIEVFFRIQKPAVEDTWSGKVWFFASKIPVGLDELVISRGESQVLSAKIPSPRRTDLTVDEVESKTFHWWFISDYFERNKSVESDDNRSRPAWDELRSYAKKEMVPHPNKNKKSWFMFRRNAEDLLITEIQHEKDYDSARKRFSNINRTDEHSEYVHKLTAAAFRNYFQRKFKKLKSSAFEQKY